MGNFLLIHMYKILSFLTLLHRASIVPVISFGENELYKWRTFFGLILNGIPWGQFILGLLPLRRPVVAVSKHLC